MALRKNPNNVVAAQNFIEGAEKPILPVTPKGTVEPLPATIGTSPSTMLIRFNDPTIPSLLAAIAEADDRSKHHIALKALALGLEEIRKDFNL